jgi:hypothetical protein
MPHPLQLQFMRDLVENNNTPEARAYGVLTNNTKLAFWYQLAVLMDEGIVIPVPEYYKLSDVALRVFDDISRLGIWSADHCDASGGRCHGCRSLGLPSNGD